MKLIGCLLCCVFLSGCDKQSERRADDCGEDVISRLGLVGESSEDDQIEVSLYEREGEYYYQLTSPIFATGSRIFNCSGELVCRDQECFNSSLATNLVRRLGYVPLKPECTTGIVNRLGLVDELPETTCPALVTLYLLGSEYIYTIANIGAACNSVTVVYNCAGEQLCILDGQSECPELPFIEAMPVRRLGYLP